MLTSSFRDPSGFLFRRDGHLFRQINASYRADYDQLMSSGLYGTLVKAGQLIAHEEVTGVTAVPETAYKIIKPVPVPFISYPYEWSFSQLQHAALLTLDIQQTALEHDLCLKDSSAYNIQWYRGRPILIDTLSFERYREGEPWVAYRQFCQHFLAPLALMSYVDTQLSALLRVKIDGIPLPLASRLLPPRSYLRPSLLTHLHFHAKAQQRFAGRSLSRRHQTFSRMSLLGLVDHLTNAVRQLTWRPSGTEWAEYYDDTNYSTAAMQHKKDLVKRFLGQMDPVPASIWDLGANTGIFSRLACEQGIETIAFDIDPAAVEKNYLACVRDGERRMLPLVCDLTNPSPGLGWAHRERLSLRERGPADGVLALALIHHLVISNNVPFGLLAEFLAQLGRWLIIEFVPKTDSQVQRLLRTRVDVFHEYTREAFEKAFADRFTIAAQEPVIESQRMLYLMRRRGT